MFRELALLSALLYLGDCQGNARQEEGKCSSPEPYKDKVACKKAGCEYNLATKSCQAAFTECNAGVGITGCRRSNAFYSEGGVAYHYKGEDQGNCTLKNVVLAINLGSWGKFTDSRNITFEYDDTNHYTDPGNSRRGVWEGTQCQYNVTGINPVDNPIWATQILARSTTRQAGRCVTYHVKIVKDGVYELNIKTLESFISEADKIRQFNIRVNGIDIVPEFNILNYVRLCEALELVIEFEVRKGKLNIAGLPTQDILYHGRMDIGFCYGDGIITAAQKYFPDYLVSAFYVAELNGATGSTVGSCSGGGGGGGGGSGNDTETTDPGVTPTPPTGGGTSTCYGLTGCRRYKSRYLEGGTVFIHNQVDQGNCSFKDFKLAVNLGLIGSMTESTGIFYESDGPKWYTDKGYSREHNSHGGPKCLEPPEFPGVHPEDYFLWRSSIMGHYYYRKKGSCVFYHSKVKNDGLYIINLKTVETFLEDKNVTRKFNIRVNDITILPEFNILDHVDLCSPLELNIEFEVKQGVLTVAGYPSQGIYYNGRVDVGFCYGDGEFSDTYTPDYLMSAIYVVELGGATEGLGGKCTTITNTPPDGATKFITVTPPGESTTEVGGGTGPCKPLSTTEGPVGRTTTEEPDPTCIGITGCRRGNAFYSEGGKVFYSTLRNDWGNCNEEEVSLALNLGNGPGATDGRGIQHKTATAEHYTDKDGIRYSEMGTCTAITGHFGDPSDYYLYGSQIRSDTDKWKDGRCMTFHSQIPKDGVYELNIKTVESVYGKQKIARQFNIRLNGMVIVPEFNIRKHAKLCEGIELIIEFQVKNGRLTATGFPEQPMSNGKVDVGLCYGEKNKSEFYDPNFLISAMYIAKMEGIENVKGSDLCPSVTETPPVTMSTTPITLTMSTTPNINPLTSMTSDPTGVTSDPSKPTGLTGDTDGTGQTTPPDGTTTFSTEMPVTRTPSQNETILPEQNCSLPELNQDPKECENAGCGFNKEACECQPLLKQCEDNLSVTKCRRSNSFYNKAGQMCYNEEDKDTGECSVEKVIMAVNLGCHCDGCSHTDNRGIKYEPDSYRLFTDKHETRVDITGESNKCKDITANIPIQDTSLYHSYIAGDVKKFGRGRCTNYNIQLEEDGRYELNIKTLAGKLLKVTSRTRTFTIQLNGSPILKEFNIRKYISDCHGIELITEFEVRDRVLIPAGSTGKPLPANGTTTLGFCFGDKEPTPEYNPSYIAAAFYVAKISEPAMCSGVGARQNRVALYSRSSSQLPKSFYEGSFHKNFAKSCCKVGPTGCVRAYAHYSVSNNFVCRSPEVADRGNCRMRGEPIIAINFDRRETPTDSRGVTYKTAKDGSPHDDSSVSFHFLADLVSSGKVYTLCPTVDSIIGPTASVTGPKSLYFTQGIGAQSKNSRCGYGRGRTYSAKIYGEGSYELSVKFMESVHRKYSSRQRDFRISLNGLLVKYGANTVQLGDPCEGVEFIVEFEIRNGQLLVGGETTKFDYEIKVEFGCGGDSTSDPEYVKSDPAYLVSAFYIVRMEGSGPRIGLGDLCDWGGVTPRPSTTTTKKTTTTRKTTTTKKTTTTSTTTTTTTTTTPAPIIVEPELPEQECTDPTTNGSPEECMDKGCKYNPGLCSCEPKYKRCLNSPPISGCRRSNSFYNLGGKICFNTDDTDEGDCAPEKVIAAVNMGCQCDSCSYNDSRGIRYEADSYKLFKDCHHTRQRFSFDEEKCTGPIPGIPRQDEMLYTSMIAGDPSKAARGRCMSYPVQIPGDGRYELSIKTLAARANRHYNIRLNDMVILQEYNIHQFVDKCSGMDLLTEFSVENGILTPAGMYGNSVPKDGKINLGFCYGRKESGGDYDPSYIAAAFYIAKMAGGGGDGDGGNVSMCSSGCAAHHGKQLECKLANCEYNMMTGRCQKSTGPPTKPVTGCRRSNVTYVEGGVASKSKLVNNVGDCKIKNTVVAVNLGGNAVTDTRKVRYLDFQKSTYIDEGKIAVRQFPAKTDCKNTVEVEPYAERMLYIFQISADPLKWQLGRCITFPGTITEDGRYELSVKTVETYAAKGKRHFNIRLNNLTVVPEFHILKYAQPCLGMELIVEFEVKNGVLEVAGFTGKPVKTNGKVEVAFCYGDMKPDNGHNPEFLVSAFYVARI